VKDCGRAIFLSLLAFRCASSEVPHRGRPDVDWNSRYGVVLLGRTEAESLASKPGSRIIETRRDGTAVLVTAEEAAHRRERGFRLITDPPFRYIDPAISDRRRSENPDVWWSGYKDEVIVEKIIRNLAANYPEYATLFEIGRSHQGRPVLALRLSHGGNPDLKPAFLFDGAHHGNEPLSIDYVLDVARVLLSSAPAIGPVSAVSLSRSEERKYAEYLQNFQIWCVPLVNPDGLHTFWNA